VTATAEGTTFASGTASDPAMAKHDMTLTLRIWRQKSPRDKGRMVTYQVEDISPDMSFLEMLDVLNEKLILAGDDPVVFDHDCREGICGSCGLMINGTAHGRAPRVVPRPPASCTCASSRTATRSTSSRGARRRSR
jgi:succinate dehydrogenase / fumarate reductase iron-sulfur subunit